MDTKIIKVGSRKSELALIQTNYVIDKLKTQCPHIKFDIVTMSTLGDRILNVSLPKIGEKSLFTKDLEDALRNGSVDFVVHSLKDLPTCLPDSLVIGAVFEREDPRDAVVLREEFKGTPLEDLPEGSVIGTSSLRRTAQLHGRHPHLKVADVRGNLNTRLRKLDDSETTFTALILAKSGLVRMGWVDRVDYVLPCAKMKYAVGQGALAVECRSDNTDILNMLREYNHPDTYCRVLAERAFLNQLGGGCSAPVGVTSTLKHIDNTIALILTGAVWSLDGKTEVSDTIEKIFKEEEPSKHASQTGETKKHDCENETLHEQSCKHKMVGESSVESKKIKLDRTYCGLSDNVDLSVDVIEGCEEVGRSLAFKLIDSGALEVMRVTQDFIRQSVVKT